MDCFQVRDECVRGCAVGAGNNVKEEMVLMARADGFRMVVNKNVGFGFSFGFVPDFVVLR
jgi:hypothetical protein